RSQPLAAQAPGEQANQIPTTLTRRTKGLFTLLGTHLRDHEQVPFPALQGEGVEYLGRANDTIIAISNYRLHIKFKDSIINVPLRLIESVESRDMFQLHIICKDSKVVRCHFSTFKQCQEWLKRLNRAVAHPGRLEDLFALAYHAWCLGGSADDEDQHLHLCRPGDHVRQRQEMEVRRMGFDMQNAWRVSDINLNYKLCSSYPQKLLVPVWITDKELESVGSFRSSKRIPVVIYRHQRNGAVIARCSQPEISWWGWRNTEDEYLVTSIAKACLMDPGARVTCGAAACSRPRGEGPDSSDGDFDSSLTGCSGPDANAAPQKLLILDARSYTAAVANRAKGGGCECEGHKLNDSARSTRWLQHLSVMLKAATLVCSAVEREGRPVLVHCSDGWDRTPQIVALAKILLDPFYRTLEGFQVLVETEWLDYGHKFGDRCGHQESAEDVNEQCPVFLQWLDCVHQLLKQFPCFFEFNEAFLVKLVQHTYSCLYGTFLCNNGREREARNIYKRTCSIWSLLRTGNKNFQNFLYIPCHEMVLQPVCHTRALQLWTAVYLPTSSPCTAAEDAMELYLCPCIGICSPLCRLPKSRSMDNLVSACENGMALTRTSSDPNLNKHCQEGRTAHGLEPMAAIGGGAEPDSPEDVSPDTGLDDNDSEVEPVTQTPPTTPLEMEPREEGFEEEELREEICLTTQPLPSLPLPPVTLEKGFPHPTPLPLPTPILLHSLPQTTSPHCPPPPLPQQVADSRYRTAEVTTHPARAAEACLPSPPAWKGPLPAAVLNGPITNGLQNSHSVSAELPALEQLVPLFSMAMEDSTETLTDKAEAPPTLPHSRRESLGQTQAPEWALPQAQTQAQGTEREGKRTEVVSGRELVPLRECVVAVPRVAMASASTVSPVDNSQVVAVRHPVSQSQLSVSEELSLLGSHWESVQGLVQSGLPANLSSGLCRALQPTAYQSRRLAGKLLRAQGMAVSNGLPNGGSQCCRREKEERVRGPAPASSSPVQSGWLSAVRSSSGYAAICSQTSTSTPPTSSTGQFLPASPFSPPSLAYLDDDGLPVPMDAVQQRLRQIEAGYKQEVEVLRRQVRQLQMRLERQYGMPPSEPDVDYEDDIVNDSDEEESLSDHSEDCFSEGSWDRVEQKDTEVTRWVPDHMASHCFNCDCEFWMAKRRHHCRNCGNVFCKDCCHLKLPIPDQQLYDPVLVCNVCYDLLLEARNREICSQQLKKPIATASS
uniref:phosphatidylinositol-3,5-bisphosphate 3-phosphatase n=1 Tax=Oncorhynchus mykiss TaxID=8022 RepID=A0A8C7P7F2_ONCMY